MADRRDQAPGHARHDHELIARVAAGDGSAADARAAAALREACPECRALDGDLRAIAAGTRAMRSIPTSAAPRDFRLSADDAERLRRRGVAGLFGRPASRGSAGMGRFGGGLVAIGLVGLLFGSGFVGGLSGFGAGSAGSAATVPAYNAVGTPAASALLEKDSATQGLILAPAPSTDRTGTVALPAPTGGSAPTSAAPPEHTVDDQNTGAAGAGDREASRPASTSPVIFVSLAALVVGLGLLIAARYGRRTAP